MNTYKNRIGLALVLVLLFSSAAFSQRPDSLSSKQGGNYLKPRINYSLGSTVTVIPHYGSVTGVTFSPFLSVPLSPKWSVEGGIIAGRYYSSIPLFNPEGKNFGTFNQLSIYGSASYHVNPQLTIYGTGMKSLITSPFSLLPKNSYSIGTTYNFGGGFSIGASVHVMKWDNPLGPPLFGPLE
jgi:hypothetical protein